MVARQADFTRQGRVNPAVSLWAAAVARPTGMRALAVHADRRMGESLFHMGDCRNRGLTNTLGGRWCLILSEAARLADDLDGNEVRNLRAEIDGHTVDSDITDREAFGLRDFVDRTHSMVGIATHNRPVLFGVGAIGGSPAVGRQPLNVERHWIGDGNVSLLPGKCINLRSNMRIAVALGVAV